jgi:hypothetical protein
MALVNFFAVKPVLTTTCEQQTPFNNDGLNPPQHILVLSLFKQPRKKGHHLTTATFWGSKE